MKGSWLHTGKENSRCLLFMAGWAMGPEPFTGLVPEDCDCFICYDFRRLDLPDLSWFNEYKQVDLLAWSMGVWVAARVFSEQKNRFNSATALAGTLYPIDDSRGIPILAYEKMEQSLSAEELNNFYASMFDDAAERDSFIANRPARSLISIREELTCLRDHVENCGEVPDIFNHHIVTTRDRIFPPRNQVRAWGKEKCSLKKWPHFPFTNTYSISNSDS